MSTPDANVTLQKGIMRLTVSPYGASLRGLTQSGQPVVTGYLGATDKVGGQGDVLIPFPGRIRDGRYAFHAHTYQMTCNDKESHSAIHGFLRTVIWEIKTQSEDAVTFSVDLAADAHPGYPFALRALVDYSVTPDGMSCRFYVENRGDTAAPVAAGFHPYFTAGSDTIDDDTLQLPFASYIEYAGLLPTGNVLPVASSAFDFEKPQKIGGTVFNNCFGTPHRDADGKARIMLQSPGGRTVTVALDKAFDYVVLYSGDPLPASHSRRALAIEPMTCASDAFNHPEWGLITLAPGETLSGTWDVTAHG